MSRKLISLSPDLKRLHEDGYDVDVRDGHLLVSGVPYVTSAKTIEYGILVSTLNLAGNITAAPDTHVAMFTGQYPCDTNGSPLTKIFHQSATRQLSDGIVIHHSFSAKPTNGYSDYYAKMTTYIGLISGHAEALDNSVSARGYAVTESTDEDSPHVYVDNASSKVGIAHIARKLAGQKIAIIGLGGTGSYVLDLIVKTPVREIHLFDRDELLQHNAFRCPGAPSIDELRQRPTKVSYLTDRYSKMHRGIHPYELFIDGTNVALLDDMDFVFICMDQGSAKPAIIARLEEKAISFIDVGMGLDVVDDALHGVLRVTASTPKNRGHIAANRRISFHDAEPNDAYSTNIQVADLNALNATLAVIKWKKLFGYYRDLEQELYCAYTLDGNHLINEDTPN